MPVLAREPVHARHSVACMLWRPGRLAEAVATAAPPAVEVPRLADHPGADEEGHAPADALPGGRHRRQRIHAASVRLRADERRSWES